MSDHQGIVTKKRQNDEEKERKKPQKIEMYRKDRTLKEEKVNLKHVKDLLKTTWSAYIAEVKKKDFSSYEDIIHVKRDIISRTARLTSQLSQITNALLHKENGNEDSKIKAYRVELADGLTEYTRDDRKAAQVAIGHGIQARGDTGISGIPKSHIQMERQNHEPQNEPVHSSEEGQELGQAGNSNKKYLGSNKHGRKNSVTRENGETTMEPQPDYFDQDTESTSKNLSEEYARVLSSIKELNRKNEELTEELRKEKSHVVKLKKRIKMEGRREN